MSILNKRKVDAICNKAYNIFLCKKNLRHHQNVNRVNKEKLPSLQDQLLYIRCETGKSLLLFIASPRYEYEKDEKLFDIDNEDI